MSPGALLAELANVSDAASVRPLVGEIYDRLQTWRIMLQQITDPPNARELGRVLKLRLDEATRFYGDAIDALLAGDHTACRDAARQGDERIRLLQRLVNDAVEAAIDEGY